MGDKQGHEFHGNQYTKDQAVSFTHPLDGAMTGVVLKHEGGFVKIAERTGGVYRVAEADVQATPAGVTLPPPNLTELEAARARRVIGSDFKPPVEAPSKPKDSFTEGMTPLARQRAEVTLDKNVTNKDRVISRRALVTEGIAQGSVVVHHPTGRRLQGLDGAYLVESQIGKIGMDFAEHLLTNKGRFEALGI